MGVTAEGENTALIEEHSAVLCFSFVRTKMLPFSTLVHQGFMPLHQLTMFPFPHHCSPSSIIYRLFCEMRETDNYSLCPPVLQWINMTWQSDSFACHFPICLFWNMKPCDTLWLQSCNPTSTNGHQRKKNQQQPWCFLTPAAFKASLDRLGCPLKTFFQRSGGQTHLRGKSGEKKEQQHVWMLAYNILHLFPFFLPQTTLASFDKFQKTMGLCVVVTPPIPVDWYIVHTSQEWWKKKAKAFLPPATPNTFI